MHTSVAHTIPETLLGLSIFNAILKCYKYACFIFACWVSEDPIWTILHPKPLE
jgi:hypothetical protein